MFTKRLFTIFIGAVLIVVAIFTVRDIRGTMALARRNAETIRGVAMGEFYTTTLALERSRNAETARWSAMGQFYTSQQSLERSRAADMARWVAMGNYYTQASNTKSVDEVDLMQRSRAAEAARWKAMGEFYEK